MSKKAAALRLVGAAIAVGTLAIIYREDIGPYTKGLMSLVSSTSASEAEAQPAQMPVPQVPVAEVIIRQVAASTEFTGHLEAMKTIVDGDQRMSMVLMGVTGKLVVIKDSKLVEDKPTASAD